MLSEMIKKQKNDYCVILPTYLPIIGKFRDRKYNRAYKVEGGGAVIK